MAKGDLKGYDASSSSYGGKYLNSITSKDGAVLAGWNSDDYSLGQFWAVFAAGVSSSTPFDQVKLEEGASYQLCWDTFSSAVAPSDWDGYYAENPPAKQTRATVRPILAMRSIRPPTTISHMVSICPLWLL